MKTRTLLFVIVAAVVANSAIAQQAIHSSLGTTTISALSDSSRRADVLFPGKGNSTLTAWTGIPYIGITEYAYSFSNGFVLGIIGGYTPTTKAIGLRLRAIIAQPSERFRIYFKSPFLFYPPSDDSHYEPWLLAWPTLNAEFQIGESYRIWSGIGLIGAGCAHHVLGIEDKEMEAGGPGFHGGVWNTTSLGISKMIGDKFQAHIETALVMKGIYSSNDHRLGGKTTDLYWDGGLPIILDMGASYAF